VSRNWLRVLDVEMWRYARSVKKASAYKDVVEEHQPNASAFLMGGRIRTDSWGFRLPDPATEARRQPGNREIVAVAIRSPWAGGCRRGDLLRPARAPAAHGLPGRPADHGEERRHRQLQHLDGACPLPALHPPTPSGLGGPRVFRQRRRADPQIPQNPFYWRSS